MPMSLKAARINKNLTQREAALLIGVSVATMANYEKGASFPDVPVIMKIEKVYGLPYSEINFFPPKKVNHEKEVNGAPHTTEVACLRAAIR